MTGWMASGKGSKVDGAGPEGDVKGGKVGAAACAPLMKFPGWCDGIGVGTVFVVVLALDVPLARSA